MADVHKPLISASKSLGLGRIAVLDVNGGALIPQESKAVQNPQRERCRAAGLDPCVSKAGSV